MSDYTVTHPDRYFFKYGTTRHTHAMFAVGDGKSMSCAIFLWGNDSVMTVKTIEQHEGPNVFLRARDVKFLIDTLNNPIPLNTLDSNGVASVHWCSPSSPVRLIQSGHAVSFPVCCIPVMLAMFREAHQLLTSATVIEL